MTANDAPTTDVAPLPAESAASTRLLEELGLMGTNALLVAAHQLSEDFDIEGKVDGDLAADERTFVVAVLNAIAPVVERIVAERTTEWYCDPDDDGEHCEWHERVGIAVMLAMRCTHDGDEFGRRAVCGTCFSNAQAVGGVVERFARLAFEQGRRAERRDWELTADLATPDDERQPWPNPYCGLSNLPAEPDCPHGHRSPSNCGLCTGCDG
ncbi:MAG: hypothetical protein CMF72_24635 [Mameliella sp.]|nr:hypothetical protein [Mameliella sp.]